MGRGITVIGDRGQATGSGDPQPGSTGAQVLLELLDDLDERGIGLVFARADADNLWYFLASEQHQYHLFGCKESGSYRFLDSPALGVGFALNTRHRLTFCVYDQTLIAMLDGTQTLAIESDIPVPAGEIGFAKVMGFLAVVLASVNIFGGFIVTQRMLAMFKKKGG